MKTTRAYRMGARAEATEETRERILAAAREALTHRWYDEVTLGSIARAAGVSQQTVVNHFGSKDGLLEAAIEGISGQIQAQRDVPPGDVQAAITALVGDYETTGDGVIRALALEGRVPALGPLLARGRAEHREWLERTFPQADAERLPRLVVATDVYTWKLLRRDQRLSRAATIAAMRELVEAVLLHPTPTPPKEHG